MSQFFASMVNRARPRVMGVGVHAFTYTDGTVVIQQKEQPKSKTENWQYFRRA